MISVRKLLCSSWLLAQAKTSAEGLLHDIVSNRFLAESMLKPYMLDTFDVAVALVPLPLLKITSGSSSSVLSGCLAPKGLLRKRENLR